MKEKTMQLPCPIPKILLPVDGSEDSKRAVQFIGCLGTFLGKALSGITVLRVLTGGYLSRHMANIDFRAADIVKDSAVFKRVRDEHVEQNIRPLLTETEKSLRDAGVVAPIEKLVTDGDAANEILRVANEGNFSTIVMARRGLAKARGFLGSVTGKVMHAASGQTVYIVGQQVYKEKVCPIPRILVPVDGSSYSMKGVAHAACLAGNLGGSLGGITILRVINMALYMERLKKGVDPEGEAQKILKEAKEAFLRTGVPENLITTKANMGNPTEEIMEEAVVGDYSLIVMGRKGRTAMKELLLGGVSSTVLQRCQKPSVVLVNS
jgi:nucleotide-binding universal stress UspA family protein